MRCITTTDARKNIAAIMTEVSMRNIAVAIGRRNRPDVLVIKYPDMYNAALSPELNFQANNPALDFLKDEPELYTLSDLKKRYV